MLKHKLQKILFCFLWLLLVSNTLEAQVFSGFEANQKIIGADMVRVNPVTQQITYVHFVKPVSISLENLEPFIKKALKISDNINYKLLKKEDDFLGFQHFRFQEIKDGVPVLGGIVIAHFKENKLEALNGESYISFEPDAASLLNEEACLAKAIEILKPAKFRWESAEEEKIIKEVKSDIHASWYPKGELIYCPKDLEFNGTSFHLSYKFTLHAYEPLMGENIYVSATTGEIIARENLLHTTNVPGVAETKYSGKQNIDTDSTAPFNYRLRENVRGKGIYTLNMKNGTKYGNAVDFLDSNNYWNNVNSDQDEIATDAHWGAEKTYDYYKDIHNRKSFDDNDARIYSYVHYSNNYDNAFWNGLYMTYGDGKNYFPLTAIDVCGHEVTHAVTTNSANLIYKNESGQLNESFSDIFGNTIERYARPNQYDWKIGEDITKNGSGLRNMFNPKLKGHPRNYKSTNWYYGTGDNGGVHLNSGVQNWWYYLITEGGKGVNDVSNTYQVDSLGINKAEQIAYRNLTVYLGPSSNYSDARFYSIRAATDLFGSCSKEVIAVTNAWYACNVGPEYDSGFVKADFTADTIICNVSQSVNFYNLSSNAISYTWNFGDANTSNATDPIHSYSNYGNYTVTLIANSCFQSKNDTMIKTAFVKIDSTFDACNSVLMKAGKTDSTSKCESFVYDDGGEGAYAQLNTSILKINVPGSDSIVFNFLDFDYENKFDSLFVYEGSYPGGVLLGGFTGNNLPFGGKKIKINSSLITLRHFSDPFVTGRGFKMYYKAYKQAIDLTAFKDTTICAGNSVKLYANGTGGHSSDYFFNWIGVGGTDTVKVSPISPTLYKVYLTDVCTKSFDSAEVFVDVRSPLNVSLPKDTTICTGQSVNLLATGSGGQTATHSYRWNNGLGSNTSYLVTPITSTQYEVILSDACTVKEDTALINITVRSPLSLKVSTNDSLICYGKNSTLTAQGNGGDPSNYVFSWSHGLGTGNSKSIGLNTNTFIKVTLSDGCTTADATDSFLVKVRPQLSVDLNKDTSICKGSRLTLTANSKGGDPTNYFYTWSPSLPTTNTNSVQPNASKKYKVTLTDFCSDDVSDSIMVTLLGDLKISGIRDTSICYGGSAQFNPIVSGGNVLQYSYLWDNGLNGNKDQMVSPTTTTKYKLLLKDNCTTENDSVIVTVNVKAALKLNASLSKSSICLGDSSELKLIISGGIPSQYHWTVNGLTSNLQSIFLKPIVDENYKIMATDNCSNKDSADFNIVVNPLPVVDFNTDRIEICRTDTINFINTSSGASSYSWDFGDNGNSSQITPKHAYKKSGVFDVSLKATSSLGCTNTATKTGLISVIDLPSSNFSYLPQDPTLANPDVNFSNNSLNFTSFLWDFGDQSFESTNQNPTHKYLDKGTFPVSLITFNKLGCTDTMTQNIVVGDIYYLWVPNAFSPNNDGINDELTIVSKGIESSEITILDRWGGVVFKSSLNGPTFKGYDDFGRKLPSGNYVVLIKLRDFTHRFHAINRVVTLL